MINEILLTRSIFHHNVAEISNIYLENNLLIIVYDVECSQNLLQFLTSQKDSPSMLSQNDCDLFCTKLLNLVKHFHRNNVILRQLSLGNIMLIKKQAKKDFRRVNSKVNQHTKQKLYPGFTSLSQNDLEHPKIDSEVSD